MIDGGVRATMQPDVLLGDGRQEGSVARFIDVHSGFFGVSAQQLAEAHLRDLAIQNDEGVTYLRTWLDPDAGKVFCLATGPSREAVMRIHERAGHPTSEVYEVQIEVSSESAQEQAMSRVPLRRGIRP
jgi:hypothetical protein